MPISTIPAAGLSSGVPTRAQLPAGSVLQVVQAVFTGTQLIPTGGVNANFTDITNLSVSITPVSSSSSMLLIANVCSVPGDADRLGFFKFTGGNTASFVGNAAGNRTRVASWYYGGSPSVIAQNIVMSYLDSPATTSPINYKVQACANFSSGNGIAINYYYSNDTDQGYIPRGASSLIVMEIAG